MLEQVIAALTLRFPGSDESHIAAMAAAIVEEMQRVGESNVDMAVELFSASGTLEPGAASGSGFGIAPEAFAGIAEGGRNEPGEGRFADFADEDPNYQTPIQREDQQREEAEDAKLEAQARAQAKRDTFLTLSGRYGYDVTQELLDRAMEYHAAQVGYEISEQEFLMLAEIGAVTVDEAFRHPSVSGGASMEWRVVTDHNGTKHGVRQFWWDSVEATTGIDPGVLDTVIATAAEQGVDVNADHNLWAAAAITAMHNGLFGQAAIARITEQEAERAAGITSPNVQSQFDPETGELITPGVAEVTSDPVGRRRAGPDRMGRIFRAEQFAAGVAAQSPNVEKDIAREATRSFLRTYRSFQTDYGRDAGIVLAFVSENVSPHAARILKNTGSMTPEDQIEFNTVMDQVGRDLVNAGFDLNGKYWQAALGNHGGSGLDGGAGGSIVQQVDLPDPLETKETYRDLYRSWFLMEPDEGSLDAFVGTIEAAISAEAESAGAERQRIAQAQADGIAPTNVFKNIFEDGPKEDISVDTIYTHNVDTGAQAAALFRASPLYGQLFGNKTPGLSEEAYVGQFQGAASQFMIDQTKSADAIRAGMMTGNPATTQGQLLFSNLASSEAGLLNRIAMAASVISRLT